MSSHRHSFVLTVKSAKIVKRCRSCSYRQVVAEQPKVRTA